MLEYLSHLKLYQLNNRIKNTPKNTMSEQYNSKIHIFGSATWSGFDIYQGPGGAHTWWRQILLPPANAARMANRQKSKKHFQIAEYFYNRLEKDRTTDGTTAGRFTTKL